MSDHASAQHRATLTKLLRNLGQRHGQWQVFRDFVAVCAISISNAVDKIHYEPREAEYMKIIGRYTKEEACEFARGLACVVDALEIGHQDFLGTLFMTMEMGDSWKGQFFTPYSMCLMMAMMTSAPDAEKIIAKKGFVSVSDPCIGGGAMVIAMAEALHNAGINYQKHMHAVAVDIDIVAVHMAYIQLSLLHVPAIVCHGNSLSVQVWSEWRTPAHIIGFWEGKINRRDTPAIPVEVERVAVPEVKPEGIVIPPPPVPPPAPPMPAVRQQLTLF